MTVFELDFFVAYFFPVFFVLFFSVLIFFGFCFLSAMIWMTTEIHVMIFCVSCFLLPAAGKYSPIDERDRSQNYPFVFATISWSLINAPALENKKLSRVLCVQGFPARRNVRMFSTRGVGGVLVSVGESVLLFCSLFSRDCTVVCSLCMFWLCLMVLRAFFV